MTVASDRVNGLSELKIRVAPSLLSADFGRVGEQLRQIEAAGVEVLHLDVMDGHFVPNISIGVPVVASLRSQTDLIFDTHLMITDPIQYAEPFAKAGADLITFHIEVVDDPKAVVDHIRALGVGVGVSLNPGTDVDAILPIVSDVDLVLVMSVWPGFGGQAFIEDVLPKVRAIRERLRPEQRLEIDGGIGPKTVGLAVAAGADMLVAGSAVFGQPDIGQAVHVVRQEAEKAASWIRNRPSTTS